MGKYSIENYYGRYSLTRCRPEEDRTPVPGAGYCPFVTADIRPGDDPVPAENTLLRLHIGAGGSGEIAAAVRSLAARYAGDPRIIGVTAAPDGFCPDTVWETVAEGFRPKRFFVPVTDGHMLARALRKGFIGGLLAEVNGDPLDICEAFALHNAQRLYESMPVLVRFTDPGKADGRWALQWHAAAAEGVETLAGPRLALRRLNYPRELTSGGFAPMQFWWTNRGPSPLYERSEARLRLVRNGETAAVILPGDTADSIHLGDYVFNRIIRLPELPEGEYRLQFGRFREDGAPLRLANAAPAGDGYYDGDVIRIDRIPRPELETVWDDWRPDGYYPLEDPAQPGE